MEVNEELLAGGKPPGPKELKFLRAEVEKPKLDGRRGLDICPEETQQLIAAMYLKGMDALSIADKVGLPIQELAKLRETPDFKELLLCEARSVGPRAVQKLINGALPELVLTLITLAGDKTLPGKSRADICFQLLDRGIGRPVNGKPLDTNITDDTQEGDPIAENELLDRKIANLKAKLEPGKAVNE